VGLEGHEVNGFNNKMALSMHMLPDTLHMFDKEDRKAYCRVLAAVALADGRVSTEEFANYESRMGMALLAPEERIMLRQELKRGRSFINAADGMHPAHLRIALRDALLMAAADGHYDAREMDVVKQLAKKASFSDEDLDNLYDWIDEGWKWMMNGRRVLSLPEEVHHWGTVYE
jgi:tellurite resistance protein|tara:strand:- start:1036 stop:1554 length:519 start_codon:yes stop_codon:yes gene_type:complete